MRVYRYVADSDKYECIAPMSATDRKITERFFECRPLFETWKSISVSCDATMGGAGDFPSLYGNIPVFSYRAWEALRPLIENFVEALPIKYPSGQLYYAINVLNIIDVLDRDRAELKLFPNGKVMRVARYSFNDGALRGQHVFKIPDTSGIELFVSSEFKKCVELQKLKGLIFQQVWPPPKR